jgi:hypothetical protein
MPLFALGRRGQILDNLTLMKKSVERRKKKMKALRKFIARASTRMFDE